MRRVTLGARAMTHAQYRMGGAQKWRWVLAGVLGAEPVHSLHTTHAGQTPLSNIQFMVG